MSEDGRDGELRSQASLLTNLSDLWRSVFKCSGLIDQQVSQSIRIRIPYQILKMWLRFLHDWSNHFLFNFNNILGCGHRLGSPTFTRLHMGFRQFYLEQRFGSDWFGHI